MGSHHPNTPVLFSDVDMKALTNMFSGRTLFHTVEDLHCDIKYLVMQFPLNKFELWDHCILEKFRIANLASHMKSSRFFQKLFIPKLTVKSPNFPPLYGIEFLLRDILKIFL